MGERLFAANRLVRAVDTKILGSIPVIQISKGKFGERVEVRVGILGPEVLHKLKTKAIFSFRQDLVNEGRERIAQIILGEDKK